MKAENGRLILFQERMATNSHYACHTNTDLQSLIHKREESSRMQNDNIKFQLEHHHKDCYGWALHCCSQDKEIAYDVVQASYLKILERQKTFNRQSSFKTWAFAIIRNTAIDEFNKKKKETLLLRSENDFIDTGYDAGVEHAVDRKLEKHFFTEALNQLSERQRQILQLVFYHDFSLNQSAEVLNISQGSARKHYDRAKKTLADWFLKNGITEFK